MAGTDRSRSAAGGGDSLALAEGAPVVILVRPQMGENIGAAARAMLNCGLTELRLVAPRDGWPNAKARAAASGADTVIDNAALFDDLGAAVADLQRVYATTARPRDAQQRVLTARQAAAEIHGVAGQRCGVIFGPERTGLTNDDVAFADTVITVPLNPAYASLNLGQAVLLVAYEWSQLVFQPAEAEIVEDGRLPATKADMLKLFEHLERELDDSGFLRVVEKRPSMVRNIRTTLQRARLTRQEVATLHGMIRELSSKRRRDD
jgi:tRNA/rRNA methyltransferase